MREKNNVVGVRKREKEQHQNTCTETLNLNVMVLQSTMNQGCTAQRKLDNAADSLSLSVFESLPLYGSDSLTSHMDSESAN